jgi:hypothetical protein
MQRKNKIITLSLRLAAVVAIILAIYFYNQARILSHDPKTAAAHEVEELVGVVSKIVILPENETPTIATVSDVAALKDQPFFAQAQKGDKVLIYTVAQKAVLYRPSVKKIVAFAPIKVGTAKK